MHIYTLYMKSIFRHDCEHITNVVKPFDWTFTTDYSGTLLGKESDVSVSNHEFIRLHVNLL